MAQHDPGAEAYRLLWLRESDRPASIRFVKKPGGTGWFYRRMTSGQGASQPGRLTEYGMSWSWKSRSEAFLNTVANAGFWNLPAPVDTVPAVCGSHWILEGIKNGKYHVGTVAHPNQRIPFA